MDWEYVTSGIEGNVELFGVNIFDYEWENTNKSVVVKDPAYNQNHTFSIWIAIIQNTEYVFAAGEFSNLFWGFYLPKNGTIQLLYNTLNKHTPV